MQERERVSILGGRSLLLNTIGGVTGRRSLTTIIGGRSEREAQPGNGKGSRT